MSKRNLTELKNFLERNKYKKIYEMLFTRTWGQKS